MLDFLKRLATWRTANLRCTQKWTCKITMHLYSWYNTSRLKVGRFQAMALWKIVHWATRWRLSLSSHYGIVWVWAVDWNGFTAVSFILPADCHHLLKYTFMRHVQLADKLSMQCSRVFWILNFASSSAILGLVSGHIFRQNSCWWFVSKINHNCVETLPRRGSWEIAIMVGLP